jgi:ribosomal silencing factor RsfS
MTDGEILSQACAAAAADKKALDIVILDLRGISTFTDYFVLCSANSDRSSKPFPAPCVNRSEIGSGAPLFPKMATR